MVVGRVPSETLSARHGGSARAALQVDGRADLPRHPLGHRAPAGGGKSVRRRIGVLGRLVEVEDLAVGGIPDAGLVLLRAGDGRVPVVHVDGGVAAEIARDDVLTRQAGHPHPRHDRAVDAVIALDLVVEAARRRIDPSARRRVLALEDDVVALAARDEAAIGGRLQGVVRDADQDGEVDEVGVAGDLVAVDGDHRSVGEGCSGRRRSQPEGRKRQDRPHHRASQHPARVRHLVPPPSPLGRHDPSGARQTPPVGGLRPWPPRCTLRARTPGSGGPAQLRAKLEKLWAKWLSQNNCFRGLHTGRSPPCWPVSGR